ncbi:MAG: anthranilate synthase component II, partial [Thermogutta sp.]
VEDSSCWRSTDLRSSRNPLSREEARLRVLVVDHQDSFVHNLARYFQLLGCDVTVRRSYKLEPARIMEEGFRTLVLSPGPRRPHDEPQSLALVRELTGIVPILGVCLGHQIIAQAFGAEVVESNSPCHGRGAWVRYAPHPCFAGIPNPFFAGRYHSLTVAADSLPDQLLPIAWTDDGHLMAICHRRLAVVGWQFHPESILTPMGLRLIQAFLSYAGIFEQIASPEIASAGISC